MTWQLTLVAVWIQFAVGATAILGATSLALRWIAQATERARLILFMLAAVLVVPLFSALTPFPSWNLGLISADTIASTPAGEADHDTSGAVAVSRHADSSTEVEGSVAPVAPQRDEASQSDLLGDLRASRAEPPASAPSPSSVIGWRFPSIDAWLILAWAIILMHAAATIYILAQRAIGKARLRRLCRAASDAPESVDCAWEAIAGSRAGRVRLLVSKEVEAPLVFGWLRPVVVIPYEIIVKDDAALACCLAHEWSHIERADMLSWQFVNLCQFVLWYQPAFWTLRRELRICQEFLADHRSVSAAAVGSVEYSELLLGLAKRRRALDVVSALTMFDQPSQLARRIRMLLEDHVPLSVRCRRPFTCCVLAVSAMLATTISAVRVDSIQADVEAAQPVVATAAKVAAPKADEKPVAHMVSYTELMTVEGQKQPIETREFIADDGRKRRELSSGGITTISDATGFIRMTLIGPTKTAMAREPRKVQGHYPMKSFLQWFQDLRRTSDKPVKELGQKELEGKLVNGCVATQGDSTYTIWADNATGEPLRIEIEFQFNGAAAHKVMTDFRLGEKLDESLFSFDIPTGYKLWQAPAGTAVSNDKEKLPAEVPADLELAWSRDGQWVAVAAVKSQSAVYGIYRLKSVIKLNEKGEELATTGIIASAFNIRAANLSGNKDCDFLTFASDPLTAYSSDEKVLWYYSKEGVPRDVCTVDLNQDGFDGVILSYTGSGGLHALDHTGKLLWKDASFGNVWSVSAGDIEGDARPEIVSASGGGRDVHVFSAEGKHLRDLDPGFYGQWSGSGKIRITTNLRLLSLWPAPTHPRTIKSRG